MTAGSRSIESWIKMLPNPTNDEEILYFRNELYHNYEITIEQYLNIFIESVNCKNTTLNEFGQVLIAKQRLWSEQLKEKFNYVVVNSISTRKHSTTESCG